MHTLSRVQVSWLINLPRCISSLHPSLRATVTECFFRGSVSQQVVRECQRTVRLCIVKHQAMLLTGDLSCVSVILIFLALWTSLLGCLSDCTVLCAQGKAAHVSRVLQPMTHPSPPSSARPPPSRGAESYIDRGRVRVLHHLLAHRCS